jgi:hypothetical protein
LSSAFSLRSLATSREFVPVLSAWAFIQPYIVVGVTEYLAPASAVLDVEEQLLPRGLLYVLSPMAHIMGQIEKVCLVYGVQASYSVLRDP